MSKSQKGRDRDVLTFRRLHFLRSSPECVFRGLVWRAVVCCVCISAAAQQPNPIADPVEHPLLPSGISQLPVKFNGPLAYVFKDEEGTDVLHFTGEFVLTLGDEEGPRLRSREAVVWITHRQHEGRSYRHLELLLWKEAEIHEVGGTLTSGPALFVSLATVGKISAQIDNVAFQSSRDSRVYQVGDAIRKEAIARGTIPGRDEEVHLRVYDASGLTERAKPAAQRPTISVRSSGELTMTESSDGGQLLTVTGGVYLSRGVPATGEYLEIQADSVIVFLPSSVPATSVDPMSRGLHSERSSAQAQEQRTAPGELTPDVSKGEADGYGPSPRKGGRDSPDRQLLSTGLGEVEVEAAYLEGDVVMRQGPNMIRASRLYYDFLGDRALILDAVVRTTLVKRNMPLYMRAAEIRQLSRGQFTAADAVLTTSEFHTPHYHVGAERVELINRTAPDTTGGPGSRAGTFTIRHATLNLGGHPILFWPYIRGQLDTSETAIKSVRGGYSDDFGAELETEWYTFNVLGLETPDGFDSTLSLDYFSRRGPAVGLDAQYRRDRYFGLLRSYLLADNEEDFLGRDRQEQSAKDVRGRFLLRHRQYLGNDWQVSLELSYISDRGFLEEFFEPEFDNDKEQETLLYLKKQHDNRAFTALIQPRILDFTSQTERLPDLGFFVIGEPISSPTGATWFSENRLGYVRLRRADRTFREFLRDGGTLASGSVGRADSRQEIGMPLDVGPVRLVPFMSVRGTAWDDSPGEGGVVRAFGTYGVHGTMYLSRLYPDVHSTLFDLDGVRHIIKPEITAWISHTNRDSHELFPFDDTVEAIDEVDGVALGLRQRWQTRRGGGRTRRTVDFFTLDVEMALFNDAPGDRITNGYTSYSRPENSISRNYLNSSVIWRVNDRTALLGEVNYDLNDGEVDIFNVSLAVERPPRLSYLVGYRLIEETDSELLGIDMNYRLTEKHTLALRELFDLEEGRALDFTVALIRKFPRWFGAISFAFDEPEDDFGISLSVWPEGLPEARLVSRRFTRLGTTTPLRNY